MRSEYLNEPELEFGGAFRHVDIRYGLMDYGPLDQGETRAHCPIRVGVVGTTSTTESFANWIERCRGGVAAKPSRYPNLFPRFPRFDMQGPFQSELLIDQQLTSTLPGRAVADLLASPPAEASDRAAGVIIEYVQDVAENANPDVVVVVPPRELFDYLDGLPDSPAKDDPEAEHLPFLHDVLKAKGMAIGVPIQFVRPETYDERQRPRQRGKSWLEASRQDEATRAWNLHTAIYYKAGGVPWRLARDPHDLTTCYVGVSFYWSRGRDRLLTSVAQVFNERGDGMILRGGPAEIDKSDRTPYLSEADSASLLSSALAAYRREHRNAPARVVLHKSARVVQAEIAGFRAAAETERIDSLDVLSLGERTGLRLFRRATYPPLRGTRLSLDPETDLLYTRGSVDFFRTYPGMYVPSPLLVRYHDIEQTPHLLASEILALTKMNWNNTSFDGALPITLRASRQVRNILRHLGPGDPAQARYSFYM
jgi:hypothetical protein